MVIDSYLDNDRACNELRGLMELSETRELTEGEALKKLELELACSDFRDRMMNFD